MAYLEKKHAKRRRGPHIGKHESEKYFNLEQFQAIIQAIADELQKPALRLPSLRRTTLL